ncbi:phage protease [Devosia sp. J2-20]|uniref:phage protease n=1 Tax=Devosia sp. J2-20 TaxID=3026161 RepID=UPI002499E5E7|nr:phage protease [Devosia sp. J2-20]WDR00742.1 phage protease [Devosia sp. J2-20]
MSKPVNSLLFGFSALQTASAPEGEINAVWHKIMPAGQFQGRDGRGPFDAGDKIAMQAIVDRSMARYAGSDLMVDYDHQSLWAVGPNKGGRAEASGWFKAFEVRDDGIYGQIQWTPAAAAKIKAGEYRYISPLFTAPDGKVDRIDNAALVNQSNLPLEAIAAAAEHFSQRKETDMNELLAKLAKALGLKDGADETAIVAAANAFAVDRGKIAVAVGINADATTDEVLTAFGALKTEAEKVDGTKAVDVDPTKFVPMSMFKDLENRLNETVTGSTKAKATEAVDKAIAAGKITPANKEWAFSYAERDLAGFEAFVGNQPQLTARQLTPAKPQDGKPALSDQDLVAMKALGLSEEQFIASRQQEAN